MKTINFATTNKEKLQIAQIVCSEADISIVPITLEIDEIQGEDPEIIVRDKALRAYEKFGKPIVVSDDTWNFEALKGFPGAYMKSVNHWFTPQDFLRLMEGVENRNVTLHQYLAYTDGKMMKIFKNDLHGKIIHEVRGKDSKSPNATVIELDSDNGNTIAEVFEQGREAVVARYKNRPDVWHELAEWYSKISK